MAAVYPAGPLPMMAMSYVVSGKFTSSVRSDDPRQTDDSRPAFRPWETAALNYTNIVIPNAFRREESVFCLIVVNRQVSRKSLGTASLLEITQARFRGSVTPVALPLPSRSKSE